MIPLADNERGLGKSTFGANYIRQRRIMYPEPRCEFDELLCASHTIRLEFAKGDLLTEDLDAKMNLSIVEALRNRFKRPPGVLSNISKTTRDFV